MREREGGGREWEEKEEDGKRRRERERRVPPVRNGRQYITRAGRAGHKMASLSGFFGRGSKGQNSPETNKIQTIDSRESFSSSSSSSSYTLFLPRASLSFSVCLFQTWFSFYNCYLILWEVSISSCKGNAIRERLKETRQYKYIYIYRNTHTHRLTKGWKELQSERFLLNVRVDPSFQTGRRGWVG